LIFDDLKGQYTATGTAQVVGELVARLP